MQSTTVDVAKAATTNEMRFNICNPWLFVRKTLGWLCATDGHRLLISRVPVGPGDVDGPVSRSVLRAMRIAFKRGGGEVVAGAEAITFDHPTWGAVSVKRDTAMSFPVVGAVLTNADPQKTRWVGLNTKLLREMAEAAGSECVLLGLPEIEPGAVANGPIEVRFGTQPDAIGVLMPVRIDPPMRSAQAEFLSEEG